MGRSTVHPAREKVWTLAGRSQHPLSGNSGERVKTAENVHPSPTRGIAFALHANSGCDSGLLDTFLVFTVVTFGRPVIAVGSLGAMTQPGRNRPAVTVSFSFFRVLFR